MHSAASGGICLGWSLRLVDSQVSVQRFCASSLVLALSVFPPGVLWELGYWGEEERSQDGQTVTLEMQVVYEQFKCSSQC